MKCPATTAAAVLLLLHAQLIPAQDQAPPVSLQITIIDGEEAINNIRQRTAREPIVQVEDENHRPIAGAVVLFVLPNDGAGGAFLNGARTLSTVTDSKGQAIARGLRPNNVSGRYQIRVDASYRNVTARATINQVNAAGAAGASAGISAKVLIALGVAAGVAAGTGVFLANRGSNNPATSGVTTSIIVITPGAGTVGPPK